MRGDLSVVRGLLDGFRLERDRALTDLAAQIAQAEAEAEAQADAAELGQQIEAGKARGRWSRLRAAWRGA